MRRFLIAAIAVSSAATAAPAPGTATLAAPAVKARVTGAGGVWTCTGTSCSGPADTVVGNAVAACTELADRNGRVTAFSAGSLTFAEAELTRCNRHIKDK